MRSGHYSISPKSPTSHHILTTYHLWTWAVGLETPLPPVPPPSPPAPISGAASVAKASISDIPAQPTPHLHPKSLQSALSLGLPDAHAGARR